MAGDRVGLLDQRVSFKKHNRIADGKGGWKVGNPAFYDLGERWASVEEVTAREKLTAMQLHPYQVIKVRIRRATFTWQPGGSGSYVLISSGVSMSYYSLAGSPVTEPPNNDLILTWEGQDYTIVAVQERSLGPGKKYYDLTCEEVV